jgi:hypothetical protein
MVWAGKVRVSVIVVVTVFAFLDPLTRTSGGEADDISLVTEHESVFFLLLPLLIFDPRPRPLLVH